MSVPVSVCFQTCNARLFFFIPFDTYRFKVHCYSWIRLEGELRVYYLFARSTLKKWINGRNNQKRCAQFKFRFGVYSLTQFKLYTNHKKCIQNQRENGAQTSRVLGNRRKTVSRLINICVLSGAIEFALVLILTLNEVNNIFPFALFTHQKQRRDDAPTHRFLLISFWTYKPTPNTRIYFISVFVRLVWII